MTAPHVPETESRVTIEPIHASNSPWRLRYWSIFCGQTLSLIGSALTQFILLWWITDSTGSISALAMAGMAGLLPQAIISPIGGAFADRYSRRMLMLTADLISSLCMLVLIMLFLTNRIEPWHVYLMMFIRSAMQAFQTPAALASVSMLVPDSFLSRAAGLNQTMQGITLVAAAPFGAFAIGIMPLGCALTIDVITALLGCLPLLIYRIPQAISQSRIGLSGLWGEFKEGLMVVWCHPGLRRLYAIMSLLLLVTSPAFTLIPLLVKSHFSGKAPEVALIEGMAGAGMIAGGIIVAIFAPRKKVRWILWGLAASCLAIAATALVPGDMFELAIICWMLGGLAFIVGDSPIIALLQSSIPNHQQGRVLSLMSMLMGLSAPVGLALTTPAGEAIGIRWLFVVMGIVGGATCLIGFLSPEIRNLGEMKQVKEPGAKVSNR
ncbi:MFS transporter [Pluralibacter gergoviae]|uniref:MFS transporter n=1 Tax=Pluralibacter gergoviae TaxID=61647 RepID=UPI000A880495|nr:MFS transporter [Pluralibacter gergoviae]EKZ9515505.1 MFS transporter [Pluralibacter gergoviae]ELC3017555.1 MFS transporter [Pluralibacter gergoviae]ELC3021776.1 MFS transporter [Pluralibacter gergoviae]ELG9928616.1 MFS transporter [Pluralibacter gergoviae]ELK5592785.1 MFS transporter [Pluralibacter gergoviae]